MDTVIAVSLAICSHFTNEHMETVQHRKVRYRFNFVYVLYIMWCIEWDFNGLSCLIFSLARCCLERTTGTAWMKVVDNNVNCEWNGGICFLLSHFNNCKNKLQNENWNSLCIFWLCSSGWLAVSITQSLSIWMPCFPANRLACSCVWLYAVPLLMHSPLDTISTKQMLTPVPDLGNYQALS